MGVNDLVVKVEGFGELWNARLVLWDDLGSCLMHVVMDIGRRRTNAMMTAVYVEFKVIVYRVLGSTKEHAGRRGGFKNAASKLEG